MYMYLPMKLKARIELTGGYAGLTVHPLVCDNLPSMQTVATESNAVTSFETERIGSLIASVDDYLMNLRVAREIVDLVLGDERAEDEKREGRGKKGRKRGHGYQL